MRRSATGRLCGLAALALAIGVLSTGAAAAVAQDTILYAAPSSSGSGNCSSAANACTLSAALSAAHAGDTIELAAGTYTGTWTVGLAVSLQGASQASTILDGDSVGTVLTVQPPTSDIVALSDVTVENGAGSTGYASSSGGGVDVLAGSLSVTDCDFTDNTAAGAGGAIALGEDYQGGTLTVTDSSFDGNSTTGLSGGAIDIGYPGGNGTADISGSTFTSNSSGSLGGAIGNADDGDGTLTVSDSTFTSNTSSYSGGAIANGNGGVGTATITGSTFTSNKSNYDDGALDNAGDGGTAFLTIEDSSFSSNSASYDGGAIGNGSNYGKGTLTISGSSFSTNTAGYSGGAIVSGDDATGDLTVTASSFAGNTAAQNGGAIDAGDTTGNGTAVVSTSTLSDNSAGLDGGAIDNGDETGAGSLAVDDSTFSDDTTGSLGHGGAIDNGDNEGSGTVAVSSSTFDGGSADAGAEVDNASGGEVALTASILAGATSGSECAGTITDEGYNISDDASCDLSASDGSVASSTTIKGYLGSLGNNGGSLQTIALLSTPTAPSSGDPANASVPASDDSLAISGNSVGRTTRTICSTPDERGYSRRPAKCDMGAWGGWGVVSITSSISKPVVGQDATYAAKVATGQSSFAGPVTFSLDQDGSEQAPCLAGSTPFNPSTHIATCVLAWPSAGDNTLYATWPGDRFEPLTIGSKVSDVSRASSSVTISSPSPEPSAPGVPITFTATVSVKAPGVATVSGSVVFSDSAGKRPLCTAAVSDSTATCTASIPVAQKQSITAKYEGNTDVASSKASLGHDVEEGYWTVTSSGSVAAHGDAKSYGSLANGHQAIGIASTPDGKGYWIAEPDGKVAAFGDAKPLPSVAGLKSPLVAIASAPTGDGYLLVNSRGVVFAYGDVKGHGSLPSKLAKSPVVGVTLTPDAAGYYLVEADGAVFGFGDAVTKGSASASSKNPVVGIAAASDTGYWLVERDGDVQHFGSAPALGAATVSQPVAAIEATADHLGYFIAESKGDVVGRGDAEPGPSVAGKDIVGFAEM
ncbi:MAG TPA: Ig-like domain repeat protein [Acidimicrobiales bacterium]|nr:Ig-like domain repeat protein [Acidimicrobiales bacterium]